MCSTLRPYVKEEFLPLQAKELSIDIPVRKTKKHKGRTKKSALSNRSKAQRLRRLREKLLEKAIRKSLTNSDDDIISTPRQEELAMHSASEAKDMKHVLQEMIKDPLHILSQDINTIQEISNSVQVSNITTDYQGNSTGKSDIFKPLCNCNATQKAIPKNTIHGRRIVDIVHFFNMLKYMNQHSKSGCNLNDVIITNEKKNGLSSSYCLKCTVCDFESIVLSECPTKETSINTDTIAGMDSIDCSFWIMNKLLSKMGLPSLTRTNVIEERLPESSELRAEIAARQVSTSPKKSYQKNSKELKQNLGLRHKPAIEQVTIANSLNENKNCEQCDFNNLLVEDKFEIKDKRYVDESENVVSQVLDLRKSEAQDNLVISQRQASLNMTRTKNEINADICDDKLNFKTNEMEIINYNRLFENNNPSTVVLPQE